MPYSLSSRWVTLVTLVPVLFLSIPLPGLADEPTVESAREALKRATAFFHENCSAGGGYVYQISSDLTKREGESRVTDSIAWLQPPATPAVGMAFLEAYRLTQEPALLQAAQDAAGALVNGQLLSGGWANSIEFDPELRQRHAYRVDAPQAGRNRRNNRTTFDDDKSQSALRFLIRFDQQQQFQDKSLHDAVLYALDAFTRAQYPCGAWPQQYSEFPDPKMYPVKRASFPDSWPRDFPNESYYQYYTLNDGNISALVDTMLLAWDVYQDQRCLDAANRAGDFFCLAQMPSSQPGWAQQYDFDMHPVWARKFEPPAITGGESQGVMRTLLLLYERTGNRKFLTPLKTAIPYLTDSLLDDRQLARFYELETNRPLFFTKDYQLTYSDADVPTHYSFKSRSQLESIERQFKIYSEQTEPPVWRSQESRWPERSTEIARRAAEAMDSLDKRGAWVEAGRLRDYGEDDPTREVIRSQTFARNLGALAEFIAAETQATTKAP